MYLKSIEINGFKSFANKIIFEFPHGITGIVGPNGSGKSNIGDAVRWVLGEQSAKQLRGSKMEDVIFSGTESRKPLGFAYVAITFENKDRKIALDYDEIKVARRVYRSGESEYLINGSICRRRQIIEIFYDTGIGKEGYSIIGQGQVEKILSGKIEDSRELFDEAAGIAKFKKDRNLTEKSLEKTRLDLDRVTDILSELEKQVGPLEEQSEKAKKYLTLRDRAKDVDINLFVNDYQTIKEEKDTVVKNLRIVSSQISDGKEKYRNKKEENQEIQNQSEEYTKNSEETEKVWESLRTEKDTADGQIVTLEHNIEKNHLIEQQLTQSKEQAENDQKARKEEIDDYCKKKEEEETILLDYQDAIKVLTVDLQKKQGERVRLEGHQSKEQEQLFSILSSNSDTKEKLSRFEAMEEQLSIRNAEYNSRFLTLRSEMNEYHEKAKLLETDYQTTKLKEEELRDAYNQVVLETNTCRENIQTLRHKMDENHQNYMRSKSRYETLINISEHYEGYQKSIKHIMEQKKKHPDIIGVVADILKMDQRYETAIEIALGGALQNIVTENETIAKKMIGFLKSNRLGRATFLPLTSIRKRNSTIHPSVLEEEGVIGVASSLVTAEPRFSYLIESLLGRTVVTDTIDHALFLSRKNNFSLRIVTLDGELLNPGGSITGGAFRSSNNLLGRNRELEECKLTMQNAETVYHQAKEEVEQLQNHKKELDELAKEKKKEYDTIHFHYMELQNQLPEMKDREKELKERLESLRNEHKILQTQLSEIVEQKERLSKHQENDEEKHAKNQSILDTLEQQIQEKTLEIAELENRKHEIELKVIASEQKSSFFTENITRLQEECNNLAESIRDFSQQKKVLLVENRQYQNELEQKKMQQTHLEEQMRIQSEQLEKIKEKRKVITERLNKSFVELEEQNEQLRLLERDETRLLARKERLETDLESQISYMWDNYEMTYQYALSQITEKLQSGAITELRSEKKALRQQIRALGNVNVNAIEEYKEVGERYIFMKDQYDDIKKAEENLITLIDKFNEDMREQFTIKFQDIREMFTKVFSDLFEGGTASLELMDETNIIESGIRIIAQPPGKKLQNIMLLSGGERALTAIALLFAIQNLKPSPFCLLDEIEAALDDANILRFSKYLKELSKDTQFIVITHRRGTMNAADVLYGITMQEKGISTLISVDLIDKQLN